MRSSIRICIVVAFLVGGCSSALAPQGASRAADLMAPGTTIDGEVVGERIDCPSDNPECAKVLRLAKANTLGTSEGQTEIADCSLDGSACSRFTGIPAHDIFRKQAGLADLVSLAMTAATERFGLAPSDLTGVEQYTELPWPLSSAGEYTTIRSIPFWIIVFTFDDGSRHAVGVGCYVDGACAALPPSPPRNAPTTNDHGPLVDATPSSN